MAIGVAFLCFVSLSGCISSEGTGSGGDTSAEGPDQSFGRIDTAKAATVQATVKTSTSTTTKDHQSRTSAKFTAKQDTVKASLIKKFKPQSRQASRIERPANPAYTVQIGAFLSPNNALRSQKLAKSRFPEHSVYSNFDRQTSFYRISVGKFDTRLEAVAVKGDILKAFPKEYSACWVNYIAK
jgi:cell division septation protein DedD